MARGWESKSVESQIEDGLRETESAPRTREQRASDARRRSLELDLRRVEHELSSARTPAHKATLESAKKFLDDEIDKL